MIKITVTELARKLSDFINRATYRGEEFVVMRGGKPVASLSPVPSGARVADLADILGKLPALEAGDLDAFAQDLETARAAMNEPVTDGWASS